MAIAHQHRTATLVGAGVGLAVFLAVALLPALLYGGYAGVLLASGIFGAPVQSTLPVRVLIVFGMVLGVTSLAGLFTIAGAAAGAAISVLVSPVTPDARPAPAPASKR